MAPVTEAYRNKVGWGMTAKEALAVARTRYINGAQADGFTIAVGKSFLDADSLEKANNPERIPEEHRARILRNIQFAEDTLPDHVISPDTLSDIKPPLSDLPASGATRNKLGKVIKVNPRHIENILGLTRADSAMLARNFGFVKAAHSGELIPDIEQFYIHQYNNPFHASLYYTTK